MECGEDVWIAWESCVWFVEGFALARSVFEKPALFRRTAKNSTGHQSAKIQQGFRFGTISTNSQHSSQQEE
jgi:hypothetical protein